MDVHQWHSNTPIYETEEDKEFNQKLEPAFKDNPEVGTVGIYEKYTRLTFVCYLREKIVDCPDDIPEEYLKESGHSKIILKEIMSSDFKEAVHFGATHIRVGTAIFGVRPQK